MFNEIHPPRRDRDGREARTALPVSPAFKAVLAGTGALACLTLAPLLWWWEPRWLAVVLLAVGLWALADMVLQWHKYRARKRDNHTGKGTPS